MSGGAEDPRIVRSRALALDAARRVFLDAGYHGATLERVAAEAGLAKRTIYNLYADKDALFRATILSAIAIAEDFTASITAEVRTVHDAQRDLPALAARLADATLLGPALALRRLVIMESIRFPELVVEYRAGAPEAVMSALAALFSRMSADGLIRECVPRVAAEHFAFLVMGADLDRGTFSGEHPSADRVRTRALAGADAFLRAYAADSG
ncbi:TetR/AcrR family transcriptional regulator [Microbacterium rhizomatis]|uniref:TetR/AcrR family transcriptional regulator n=1 Tax=Microbacterium rhizomatis TaxID=1631477 RepID=A0A5J5J600_9MICO|nr:TetR/AcrR family transcriptional regulator [Microbacterium rhizomatis]KAA9111451.1 TetR/AcrR family transcriptional regulator [Microbacterium rhizomatis]